MHNMNKVMQNELVPWCYNIVPNSASEEVGHVQGILISVSRNVALCDCTV